MLGLTRHQLTEPHTSGLPDVIVQRASPPCPRRPSLQVPKVADLIPQSPTWFVTSDWFTYEFDGDSDVRIPPTNSDA